MRRCLALTAALLCAALTACTGNDPIVDQTPSGSAVPSASAAPSPLPTFDPPRAFDTSRVRVVGAPRGFVYPSRQAVYAVRAVGVGHRPTTNRAEVQIQDPTTGGVVRTFSLDAVPNRSEQIAFVEFDGEVQLFAAYSHLEKGAGTAADQYFLRVRRYSLQDGGVLWSADIALPSLPALRNVFLVGISPEHVVISARERSSPGAEISRNSVGIVLSTTDGGVRWMRERFIPYALHGDVVPGTTPKPDRSKEQNRVEALDARTGSVVWRFSGFNIDRGDAFGHPVGDRLVQITTNNGKLFDRVFNTHLVDIATGKTVARLDHEKAFDCLHDAVNLIVCHSGTGRKGAITAFDATTYQRLWTLDENTPGRRVPRVLFAYRGLVYVGLGGTIVAPSNAATLDGQTGEDVDVDLGIVPFLVGPGYAIAHHVDGLAIYRATG